jgi:hypothetical protein
MGWRGIYCGGPSLCGGASLSASGFKPQLFLFYVPGLKVLFTPTPSGSNLKGPFPELFRAKSVFSRQRNRRSGKGGCGKDRADEGQSLSAEEHAVFEPERVRAGGDPDFPASARIICGPSCL